jgi:hypothetical protein
MVNNNYWKVEGEVCGGSAEHRLWRKRLHELMERLPYLDEISILNLAGTPPREPMWQDFHPFIEDPDYVKKLRKLYPGWKSPELTLDLGCQEIFGWRRARPWQIYFEVPWKLKPRNSWEKLFERHPTGPKLIYGIQRRIDVGSRRKNVKH